MCVDGAGNDCVGSGVKIVMVRVIAVGVLVIAALTGACSAQTDRQASAARSTTTGSTRRPGPAKQTGAERVGVLPQRPAALAVGPDGGLYIADDTRNEILERWPDGHFRVFAGSGVPGFAGDGSHATKAELNYPSGMAFAPDGTLYFADQQNGRVRAVSLSGIISTIAGNGRLGWVATGTPASQATLEPFDVKFGPDRALYVVSAAEVLRLERNHTFTRVAGRYPGGIAGIGGPAVDASTDGANAIAFDRTGGFYLAGSDNKTLLYVSATGNMTLPYDNAPFYPRGNAGIVTTADGTVIAMDLQSVVKLAVHGEQTIASFAGAVFRDVHNFQPNGITVARDGTIYVDTWNGDGFADAIAIVAINPTTRTPAVLWWHR